MIEIEATEDTPMVSYGGGEEKSAMNFIRLCPNCGRFVKGDEKIEYRESDGLIESSPNATCKKCGRITMIFNGFY
mgnify:CR=1 FL=1